MIVHIWVQKLHCIWKDKVVFVHMMEVLVQLVLHQLLKPRMVLLVLGLILRVWAPKC
jgi:hypothetical protein